MKKYIPLLLIVVLVIFIYPSTGLASYKVILKNGSLLHAAHYWEEEGKVFFYTSGGILGVGKDSVKKIEELEVALRVVSPPAAKPAQDLAEIEEAVPEAKQSPADKAPSEEKGPAKNKLMDEFNAIKGRHAVAGSLATEELITLSKDMTAFRDKVLQSRLGFVYSDQLVELYSMGDEIESILKSRGQ